MEDASKAREAYEYDRQLLLSQLIGKGPPGAALQFASPSLRDDPEIVLKALSSNPESFEWAAACSNLTATWS